MKQTNSFIFAIIISFVMICLAGCQAGVTPVKPFLDEEGEVFVYVQPLPQEAERLGFDLDGISAVRQDGMEVPLDLSLKTFTLHDVRRQRLMASGILPPGVYRGLSLRTAKARLLTDEGEASLLLPEKPVVEEVSFTIAKKKATLLLMNFLYQKSVSRGFTFSPEFTVYQPGKPVIGLIGYVSNTGADTITVFDKKAGQVVGVLATGREPKGVAFDQVRNRAYVALSGEDAIEAFDISTGDPLNTIRLHPGSAPQDLALTADGRLLMSVNPGSNDVSFVDPLSYLELSWVSVGYSPASILIEPTARRRAYVFNVLSNSITVIDIAAKSAAFSTSVETGPLRGQFSRDGSKLYVIYGLSPYVTVLDPASLRVTARAFIGSPSEAVKIDAKTDLIYIAGTRRDEVEIYEPLSLVAVDSIPAGGGVSYLTIDDQENNLLMLSPASKSVTGVNINTKDEVFRIDVGEDPYQVTLMGER